MTTLRAGAVLRQIDRLITAHDTEPLSDRELLEDFIRRHDEAAFTALLHRHGPMVMRVCRRVLNDWHLAEDVFQATFLVLARQAATVRRREGVGGWLHGVAYRLALKARLRARRPLPEPVTEAPPTPLDQVTMNEARGLLDEELQRLHPKYREPILLCYLEERTRDEAARQLGWPLSTLKSRVERGRELLRRGLERRGLTFAGALLATTLAPRTASAGLSAALVRQTAQAALQMSAGAAAGLSTEVVSLAKGALQAMTLAKIKWAAVTLLALALVCTGGGLALHQAFSTPEPAVPPDAAVAGQPATARDAQGDPLPPDSQARLGTVRWRQEDNVHFLSYLPDGRHLLTRGQNGQFHLWDRHTGQVVRRFGTVQKPPTLGGYFGAQSQAMMSMGAKPGEELSGPGAAALAPDGRTLAAAERDGTISLWEVATGKEIRRWKTAGSGLLQAIPGVGPSPLAGLRFSPDGRRLAVRAGDGSLRLWSVADGKELRKLDKGGFFDGVLNRVFQNAFKESLAFTADGKVLASAEPSFRFGKQGVPELSLKVKRWEVETGKAIGPSKTFTEFPLFGTFSPDGKVLAIATVQNGLLLWDLAAGREIRRLQTGGGVFNVTSHAVFSPDGRLLAVKEAGRAVRLWDVAEGKELRRLTGPADEGATAWMFRNNAEQANGRLVFAPDGRRLAGSEGGRTIRQWDVASGQDVDGPSGHRSSVEAVGLAPGGRTGWSRGADEAVIQWDVASGKVLRQLEAPAVTHTAAAPGGRVFLLGFSDGTLAVRDAHTGQELRRWKAHVPSDIGGGTLPIPPLLALALAPDGRTTASWGADQTIRLWDVATGRKVQELPGKIPGVDDLPAEFAGFVAALGAALGPSQRLAFSADGARLAVLPHHILGVEVMTATLLKLQGGEPKKAATPEKPAITLWDLSTGRLRRRFEPAAGDFLTSAFAPDGRTLAVGQSDGAVVLWETATGKPRGRLQAGKENAVRALCYTADGRALIGGCQDGTLRLWDPLHGREVRRLSGHQGPVVSLARSADGKTVVSGSQDTTALVWPMPATGSDATPTAGTLGTQELEGLWGALAGADAAKAFQAIQAFTAAPAPALVWLRERLQPASGPDSAALARWVGSLNSDQFDVRKRAAMELEKLGPLARPALERARAANPPLAVRQQIDRLLEKQVTTRPLSHEELRGLRSVEILERIGTPEARRLLEKLATGAEGTPLSGAAATAVKRLAR